MSESGFGMAVIKAEGACIPTGYTGKQVETIWFEMAFTKAQYTLLAKTLATSDNEWVRSIADVLVDTRDNAYQGG